jgi:hypothetical protein
MEPGGSAAWEATLARLVLEAPLAVDLAPYYERHVANLLTTVASLPSRCVPSSDPPTHVAAHTECRLMPCTSCPN